MPKKDTVWCILSNESISFSIKIKLNKTVDDMKKKIHKERNKTLAKIDSPQLKLYRVEIPGLTTLSNDVLATIVQQKLSEPLIELDVMRQLVEVGVKQDTLIIAKAPTPGK
jgi:Crinkler effector protein N-terminal domain